MSTELTVLGMVFENYDRWREHPMLRGRHSLARLLPGFGTASVIFATYLAGEYLYKKWYLEDHHNSEHAGHH